MTSFLVVEQVISEHRYAKPSIQSLSSPGSKPRPIMAGYPPRLHLYLSATLNIFINPTPAHLLLFLSVHFTHPHVGAFSGSGLCPWNTLPPKLPESLTHSKLSNLHPFPSFRAVFPRYNLLYLKISEKKCLPHSSYPILLRERQQYPT